MKGPNSNRRRRTERKGFAPKTTLEPKFSFGRRLTGILTGFFAAVLAGVGCAPPAPLPVGPGKPELSAGTEETSNLGESFEFETPRRSGPDGKSALKSNPDGGYCYEVDGSPRALVGIDLFAISAKDGDDAFLKRQLDSASYSNCNTVTVPMVWWNIENREGNYDFRTLDRLLKLAAGYGFNIVLYWHGSNFAAIDMQFTPDYIMADRETYSRVKGFANESMLCLSDPDTLARERTAYARTLKHVSGLACASRIAAVIATSELDYLGALGSFPNYPGGVTRRCSCENCNAAALGFPAETEGRDFMARQTALYGRELVLAGEREFDLPTLSQIAPFGIMEQGRWRYAENAETLYAAIQNPDHVCAPSVTDARSFAAHRANMRAFADLRPNYVFSQGTDIGNVAPGTGTNGECAPFLNLLEFGGQGAIYWDPGKGNVNASVTKNAAYESAFRDYFGLLKGIEYPLVRNKKNPANLTYWTYENAENRNFVDRLLGNFRLGVSTPAEGYRDYGIAIALGEEDFVFGVTNASKKSVQISLSRTGGLDGFVLERGCFDPRSGEWYPFEREKTGALADSLRIGTRGKSGEDVLQIETPANFDAGDFRKTVWRVYRPETQTSTSGNAAFGKAVFGDAGAENAVDGNPFTSFAATAGTEFQIDLGGAFDLCELELKFENSAKRSYSVYAGADGKTFRLVKRVTGEQISSVRELSAPGARYLRIVFDDTDGEALLSECAARGIPSAAKRPDSVYRSPFGDDPSIRAENKANRVSADADGENIALRRPVEASNAHLWYPAERVNDGSPSTFWTSPSDEQQWITVDLGTVCDLRKYVVRFCGGMANAVEFGLLVSEDGLHWEYADKTTKNSAQVAAYAVDCRARWVRLYLPNPCTSVNYRDTRVSEFEIYAKK